VPGTFLILFYFRLILSPINHSLSKKARSSRNFDS
jgi:hypothetical protein